MLQSNAGMNSVRLQPPGRAAMLRSAIQALAVLAIFSPVSAPAADEYPQRPIRMLVGFAAGGPTDQAARIVAEAMSRSLGQPVVVENRPGANSMIAARALVSSKPDGYTVLLASNGVLTVAGARYKEMPFDVRRDFTPVGSVAGYSHVLVTAPDKAPASLVELISRAKSSNKPLTIASVGHVDELTIALFHKLTGVPLDIIPYKGQSAVLSDLMTGRVDVAFLAPTVAKPQIAAGKLAPIAVTGRQRVTGLPDVPPIQEAGVPGFEMEIWNALMVPTGTPAPVADTLAKSLHAALEEQSVRDKLEFSGLVALPDTPSALAAKIDTEGQKWKKLAEEENLPLVDF
ncbi:Bug family tripartite tricarboxylate transporter substrate binding protein [Xanthobacter flavus]|uniref:Bug family tripartite tricarboxylate transporter substrate binding protein n=1 Tax=Xanthobacter flavus TaxID=281 RepID=UPI0037274F8A